MKRIAVFCDGTWNTPDKMKDGKLCQTNVVKMANALSQNSLDGTVQLLYYDTGIGSEGNVFKRIFDGATGSGISEKIQQAYRFIINNYKKGDELFMFGFSRGAFTVRSLSGLIRNSGILKPENMHLVPRAYSIYRSRKKKYQPREVESILFRKTYAVEETTRITFIGVWDTVGALGNPLIFKGLSNSRNQFHDTDLSSKVEYAYHALAIDENRKNFKATLWQQQAHSVGQVLEQVWFAGVHSNVGGGYPESGLSDVALQWMLEKARNCNLNFDPLGLNPDTIANLRESYKGCYRLVPRFSRPIDKADRDEKRQTNETLHPSVVERYMKIAGYRPQNLEEYFKQHPLKQLYQP